MGEIIFYGDEFSRCDSTNDVYKNIGELYTIIKNSERNSDKDFKKILKDEWLAVCNAADRQMEKLFLERKVAEKLLPQKPDESNEGVKTIVFYDNIAKHIAEDERYKKMKTFNIRVLKDGIRFIGKEYSGDSKNLAKLEDIVYLLSIGNVSGDVDDLDGKATKWFIRLCHEYVRENPDCRFEVTVI